MTRKLALLIVVGAAVSRCDAQNPPQDTKERWNTIYSKPKPTYPTEPNKFLTAVVRGRKTGKALDVGMGSGRNSLFLAQQGWDVTGVDISDEGIRVAKQQAAKLGVKLHAVLQSADEFDFGKEQWDLIVGMYVHNTYTRNAVRIREGLKPGGIVVVEGFHREHWKPDAPGWKVSYQANELLKAFEGLRILRYEETTAPSDCAMRKFRLVYKPTSTSGTTKERRK